MTYQVKFKFEACVVDDLRSRIQDSFLSEKRHEEAFEVPCVYFNMLTEAFRQYSEKVTLSRQRKLNNAECIVQIKREISLAKTCLICKHRASFLENHELSRAALIRGQRLNLVNKANTYTTHNFSSRSDEGLTLVTKKQ